MLPKSTQPLRITTLVSAGAHPDTGRARRAATDARAVELAMTLGADVHEVLHAGDPDEPTLAYYGGMGLSKIRILEQEAIDDAVYTLTDYLKYNMPDIVLTGQRAECGESSGLLPFLLAHQLQCPIVVGITEILSIENGIAQVLQALPRGQRRAISVSLPFVASVDMAAPEPRQSAFGRMRYCQLEVDDSIETRVDAQQVDWQESPAKARVKRLRVVKGKSAADRFKAATAKAESSGGKMIRDQPVSVMAHAIIDLLLEEGVISR
jgi:electron transfer flavoprotein beta subunit